MWFYSDFLEVDQRYYPVYSEEQDRDDPQYWQTFVPHRDMTRLLEGYVRTLEGTTKKSLWIHGAYGTGKTHAQFVLKHLTEASQDEVEAYFRRHKVSEDLLGRVLGLRKRGKGLVVYRSSASSIDSQRRLMMELQVGIKKSLGTYGLADATPPSLADDVAALLCDKQGVVDWPRLFERHRAEYRDFASADEVLHLLTSTAGDQSTLALVARVAQSLEAEGFYLMDDPASIKEWIKLVVRQNQLAWLVVMWDEFTDFMKNVGALAGLQELAHLSAEVPFYLVLTTHRSPDLLHQLYGSRHDDWRKLLDRFELFSYDMEPVTAYQLLGRAVIAKKAEEARWAAEQAALWDTVRLGAKPFLGDDDRLADLQALVPLHPYAAYLLSQISRQFTSSQRTLFRFLRHDVAGSFSQFLKTHPYLGWKWYTADGLWDYFFGGEAFELPEGFRQVVGYYGSRHSALNDDFQLRAFKATVLLIGLSREIAGVAALQPTLSNLRSVFAGTSLGQEIDHVMDELGRLDLVRAINQGTDRQYTIALGDVDAAAVGRYAAERRFDSEAQAIQVTGSIGFTAHQLLSEVGEIQKRRMVIKLVSADELERRRENAIPACAPYQIPVVAVLTCTESEIAPAVECILKLPLRERAAIVVLPQVAFGAQRWHEWCRDQAHVRWYGENHDNQNATYYVNAATTKIAEWSRQLRDGQFRMFGLGPGEARAESVLASGVSGYRSGFETLVERRFQWRPELICPTATLYRETYGVKGAEVGLGLSKASAPYVVLVEQLRRQGLWPEPSQLLRDVCGGHPDHPLARLSDAVDAAFAEQDSVNLDALWAQLESPPFGYFPSPISVTLVGAALRGYVDGFYWRDGVNTRPLDRTKLAGLINEVIGGKANVILTRNTPEAREFCELLRNAFGLDPEASRYPQNARDSLRKLLTTAGYPLWALSYASSRRLDSIAALQAPLGDRTPEQVELENEKLGALLPSLRSDSDSLAALVQRKPFEEGMRSFVARECPALLEAAGRLSRTTASLMDDLRTLMQQETWLWTEEGVSQRLPALHAELSLVAALNGLLGTMHSTLEPLVDQLRTRIHQGRVPLFVLATGIDEVVVRVVGLLDHLIAGGLLPTEQKLELAAGLETERAQVRAALEDKRRALLEWSATTAGVKLTVEEAAQVLAKLPETGAEMTPSDFKMAVEESLRELAKRRLIDELSRSWLEATGSAGPDGWSQTHGVPLHWLLDSKENLDLLAVVSAPEGRDEGEIRNALAMLQRQDSPIRHINDQGRADKAFLEGALGEYEVLVEERQDVEDLRASIRDRYPNVSQWERTQIRAVAKSWLGEKYQARLYPKLQNWLQERTDSEMRKLLLELSKDPLVGAKLLERSGL